MPTTFPSHCRVARIESRCGISMILVASWSELVQPPIWAAEKEHGWQVSHCASIAATFIGWYLVSMTPRWLPTRRMRIETGSSTPSASFIEPQEHLGALPAPDLPGGDREHDQAAGHQRREDHVRVAPDEHRVGEERADRGELGPAGVRVDLVADRVLHPGVGGHDERRRQGGTHGDRPDRQEVQPLGQHVPAEPPQPQEGRLEEEGGQALHRERRAEDVTDEARVLRPVHPELELLDEPGDDADGDVDDQDRAEEPGQPAQRPGCPNGATTCAARPPASSGRS